MAMILDFEREPALKAILSSLDQGVAIFGPDRTLLFINDRMRTLTGGRGAVGGALSQLARDHALRDENGASVSQKDFPIEHAFKGVETHDRIFEYINPDGKHVWLSVSCVRICENDELRYIVTTVTDVTNRKRREDKLRFMVESAKILSVTQDFKQRLTEKAKLAVPSLADWCAFDILRSDGSLERVVVVHRDPKMIAFVQDMERKYPSDPDDPNGTLRLIKEQRTQFIPHVTRELIDEGIKDEAMKQDFLTLRLNSIMVIPIIVRSKGLGAMTLAYAESGRTYDESDFQFFKDFCSHVGVLLDNARLFEELDQRDKAKDTFLASLSHELRNPLAPIKSSLELLKMKDLLPDVREEVDVIEHQFDHMAHLLNDLLDVSRFTSGKITVMPVRANVSRLVERALRASETLIRGADITLSTHYPAHPVYSDVDETRLEQAIQNLVSNAAKFTPAGGMISVDVKDDLKHVTISVKDSGAGIDAKDLPHIFDLYYQADSATGMNAGLGIGLPLVKRIAELHGGAVMAHSDGIGRGSAFTITLPLSTTSQKPKKREKDMDHKEGLSVIVVDDNVAAADALAKLLNKIGMRAKSLYSARETLNYPEAIESDLILLDVGMPEMDGYELVGELRKRGFAQPIIALTGYGLESDVKEAKEAGFTAHLTKPIGLSELRALFAQIS